MVHNLRTIGFQELVAFVTVVKQGGITAAAKELNVAKSAVSNQLTKLEQRLNVKLMNRHSRRVSLTKEGEHLLPRIESLLAEGERLFEEAELEENLPQGVVKIASTPEFAQWVLVNFVPLVTQAYPDIKIILKTAYDFEDLQDPSFDLAFRINKVKDDRLVARNMGYFQRCFYSHPKLTDIDKLTHPSALSEYPCLGFSDVTTNRLWNTIEQSSGETLDIAINTVAAVRNFNVLGELASVGQGICYIPSFVARCHVDSGDLVNILPNWRSKQSDVFLAYRPGVDRIGRVKAVLELAKEAIPELIKQKA